MCKFLSAIVFRNGDILCDPEHTDSHEELIASAGLDDTGDHGARYWRRVEFYPENDDDLDKPEKYILRDDDEATSPEWFVEMQGSIADDLRRRVKSMIVADEMANRSVFLGGMWIVRGKEIEAKSSRVISLGNSIVTVSGNSRVVARDNSIVTAYNNSTVMARNNSIVRAHNDSSVVAYNNSTVTAWNNSIVTARDNSIVVAMDRSAVTALDNSTITAYDDSIVTARDNSVVKYDKT